jgi:hypothetical protein
MPTRHIAQRLRHIEEDWHNIVSYALQHPEEKAIIDALSATLDDLEADLYAAILAAIEPVEIDACTAEMLGL